MSEWKEYTLSEIGTIARGKSKHRPRDASFLYGGKYPFIQTGDIKASNHKIYNYTQTYSESGLNQSKLWPINTLCITIAANIADTGILTFPACFPDSVIGFVADDSKCDIEFIEYLLQYYKKQIQSHSIGSVQDNINLGTFEKIKFRIPGLAIQKAIKEILSSLDHKIELNNKINQELESLAQLLFKRWFVDFEFPNENGEPYKSSGGEMVDSELGEIPSCFTINNIKDFGDVICGKTPSKSNKEYYGDDIPFVKIPDMHKNVFVTKTEDSLSFKGANSQKNKTLEAGTVILSSIATVGLVSIISRKSQTNQQINAIVPIKSHLTNFLYLLLKSKNEDFQQLASGGSTTLNMNTSTFKNYKVINPSEILLLKFNDIIDCLFKEIYNNIEESHCLMKMRDTLLPKLIIGELQINEN